ncbi:MAG: hypothetical protein V3R47_03755 [candidate division NC10 bacterium]
MADREVNRGFQRRIPLLLLASLLVLGTAIQAAAQCAYPALELLDFDFVVSSQTIQSRAEGTARNVCLTAPIRQTGSQGAIAPGINYEFEARLLVINTFLRWLHLDAVAEAWTPLPSSSYSH